MSLSAEVIARVSDKRLVQLTNGDGEDQTTVNTTRLGYAVTDAMATMELEGGVTYDGDNPVHVDLAISGVISKLQEYGGNGAEFAVAHRQRWLDGLKTLRQRGSWVIRSSSAMVPKDETPSRPKLDADSFSGYSTDPMGTAQNGISAVDEDEGGL